MGRTLKPPLDLVLAWQTDAYPHGVRRDHTLLILATVFSAIAFIFVLVRLTARLGIQRNPGLDDLFIVPALVSSAISSSGPGEAHTHSCRFPLLA